MSGVLRAPAVGAALLLTLGAWCLLSHPAAPEALSGAGACALLAAGLLAGARLGRRDPAVPGLLVLLGSVAAIVVTLPESVSGDPLAPPLGYLNANGALLLCGAAGGIIATDRRTPLARLLAALAALVLGPLCWLLGAQAAGATAVLLAGWALLRRRGPTLAWVVAGILCVSVPVVLTVAWGADRLPRPAPVVSALSHERFGLWSDAWQIMVDHPVSGIGAGRFVTESATAVEPDLAWAHSYALQIGAELGVVGLGLLLLALGWAVLALDRDSVLLGLLLLPAVIDHVLHSGGVLIALSLVIGGVAAAPERVTVVPIRAGHGPAAPPGRGARTDRPWRAR